MMGPDVQESSVCGETVAYLSTLLVLWYHMSKSCLAVQAGRKLCEVRARLL